MQTPTPTASSHAELDGVVASARHQAALDRCQRNVWRVPASDLPASYFHRDYQDRAIPFGAVLAAVIGADGALRWRDDGQDAAMQTPTPTPTASPAFVAHLAQIAELELTGRRVLLRDGYASLARQAADLFAALYSLQSDGIRGAEDVDTGPLEDLGALLQRLAAEARSAAA